MNYLLDIAYKNRKILSAILENYTFEQINKVPNGFKNNLIWNVAHVIVTQQLLVYDLSGVPMTINSEMVEKYRKGTKAEIDVTQQEVEQIKALLFSTLDSTMEDYKKGTFKNYKTYTTSMNVTLNNVEEATAFNNFHEGIHLGYILALKKAL